MKSLLLIINITDDCRENLKMYQRLICFYYTFISLVTILPDTSLTETTSQLFDVVVLPGIYFSLILKVQYNSTLLTIVKNTFRWCWGGKIIRGILLSG